MTKFTSKFLLVGAAAALAIAISAAPSEAAKRRAAMTPKGCTAPGYCSTNCSGGWCQLNVCGLDGKWYPSVVPPICAQGLCPNVQRKC